MKPARYRSLCALLSSLATVACGETSLQPGGPGAAGYAAGGSGGQGSCAAETCNGFDDDCDGSVDEDCPCDDGSEQQCFPGSPLTVGIGQCRYGSQTCSESRWNTCQDAVVPGVEFCNGYDDDCDGYVDEDCPCDENAQQDCYSGSPETVDIGQCRHGFQSCQDGEWTPCQADVVPAPESCDQRDNDCDGVIDEGCPPPPPPPPPARCSDQFQDVPPGHMFYEEIHALYVHSVVNGCSPSPLLYCPDDPALRKHLAVMLINAMGESPSSAALNAYFTDLTDTASSGYINRMFELGITQGCGTGLFCPDDPATREHAAVFLIRAMGESPSSAAQNAYFDDLGGSTGYAYINRLSELGISHGCGTRLFCPDDPCQRDSAAAFVARGFDYTLDICDP